VAGALGWVCGWAAGQNGVSQECWLRKLHVEVLMEVDGSRAGRAGTREMACGRGW